MHRRDFIKNSSLSTAAVSLGAWKKPVLEKSFTPVVFATKWGYQKGWEDFVRNVKDAGYDGIEVWLPRAEERRLVTELLKDYDLKWGILVAGSDPDFTTHKGHFSTALHDAIHAELRPEYINCHSGRDFFEFEENAQLIEMTLEAETKHEIPIYHETHRRRMLYTAPSTRKFINRYPQMTLTLDISHWCVVHESLLEDQQESVNLALSRTRHIHARVGHEEAAQVSEPRAPEWSKAVDAHLKWWDKVVENSIAAGETSMTFLTEFGPPHYLPTLPYTKQPVADQWDINVFMKDLIKSRYA